ncbi:NADPH-dependent oxidoreductase [Enterococcus sp. MMGLQ5-2]|nr:MULTISPECIES: nitroreductase family protein [unclassified Enterococcus]MBS7576685.1 nitroreductase family protein [Enterococcus sp. MMGLQ5-2]MBS7583828.1 nitroreductase family protein [Enterococcus sp. MMGLQ5-1]NPD11689.1 NADPH-dependent oxidoreductase [Enterococcus sp. MMGLQ5-1]NPD36522.1 NADPH-dependent oxidoreductase [Enterococcus sp. MMGLQ5-2]
MNQHFSVRQFKKEKISDEALRAIIDAGRSASTWMNFQSYSIIIVKKTEKKQQIYDLLGQPSILSAEVFLVFVGDFYRAKQVTEARGKSFNPEGVERLLVTSVDAALVAQNTLLAAESIGLGGVIIGMLRTQSEAISELLELPDYTYPLIAISLGVPDEHHEVKPRLPYENVVFDETYQILPDSFIKSFDEIQSAYGGGRQATLWSERVANYFSGDATPSTLQNLKNKKLM